MLTTLKDLCVEQIIQNFDRHILAYSTCNNVNWNRNYEVLRRKYSLKIIEKLHEDYIIRDEHIDFLLNKYLKTLDTDWLEDCSWNVIVKKITEIGSSLETLHLNADDDSEMRWETILCHLPNLKIVDFHTCNDVYLDCISKFCPQIESIVFGPNKNISPNGFKYLCAKKGEPSPCPHLREIKMNFIEFIEKEDIMYLIKNLPSLEVLKYYWIPEILYSLHKDDINNLDKIKPYNLTDLDMMHMHSSESLDDALKICLSLCPRLKTLTCPVLKQEHLNLCSKLTGLEHLSVTNFEDSPFDINNFLKIRGSKLVSLKASNFSLSVAHLAQTCPCLDTLQLSSVTFHNSDDTVLMFCNLKCITFEHMNFESLTAKAVTSFLVSSLDLERLNLENCGIFSSDIKTEILRCCEHGTIKHISFAYSSVELKFARDVLLTCSNLETLNLEGSTVGTNFEEMEELEAIALTLPNRPEILYHDQQIYSDYDGLISEYGDFLNSDEDYDCYDYDYDDSESDADEYDDCNGDFYGLF